MIQAVTDLVTNNYTLLPIILLSTAMNLEMLLCVGEIKVLLSAIFYNTDITFTATASPYSSPQPHLPKPNMNPTLPDTHRILFVPHYGDQ